MLQTNSKIVCVVVIQLQIRRKKTCENKSFLRFFEDDRCILRQTSVIKDAFSFFKDHRLHLCAP